VAILILGLVIFLGVHSIRIFAPAWRTQQMARLGERGWKGLYAATSLIGFVLIVYGYGLARAQPTVLWVSPGWLRALGALLTIPAFILLAAAYVPHNRIKAKLGHPMAAGVKTWAFAHLLANGTLHAVILFGSFLAWSVIYFAIARRIDRAAGTRYPAGTGKGDAITVVSGLIAWALFAFVLHGWLIGVKPMG
jgi:uncharacterized membrane protein